MAMVKPAKGVKEEEKDYTIKPEDITPRIDSSDWPLLLKNYTNLAVRTGHFTPITAGCSPLHRDLKSYVNSGVINLDKPSNPSSHEVVAWVKRLLRYGMQYSVRLLTDKPQCREDRPQWNP